MVKSLFETMGFESNPFSKFSAEEELSYLNKIYFKPKYFQSLLNDISSGSSRFIFGERGSGKSALIIELNKELLSSNTFSVIIDGYDEIPIEKNEVHIILLIFKKLLKEYIFAVSKNRQTLSGLDRVEKEKLSIFIKEFFSTISKKEFSSAVDKVERIKVKNILKRLYNKYFNKPLNVGISSAVEITSDWISKHFGLQIKSSDNFYKEYLPEFKIEEIKRLGLEKQIIKEKNYKKAKELLADLIVIIKKSDYKGVAVFFDKVDEFKNISGKIHKIVEFTQGILRDTELLYQSDLSLVFSLWSEVKHYLNETGVRFDKFKPVDISWNKEELLEILKKRVNYFNKNHQNKKLMDLFPAKYDIQQLLKLSNKAPRDMIRLFSAIYDEQEVINSDSIIFDNDALSKGCIIFCKAYDYYSLYPSEKGSKEDIIPLVDKLLKLRLTDFTMSQFGSAFGFSGDQIKYHINLLVDCCLIKGHLNEHETYTVEDPKVSYLIAHGHLSLN